MELKGFLTYTGAASILSGFIGAGYFSEEIKELERNPAVVRLNEYKNHSKLSSKIKENFLDQIEPTGREHYFTALARQVNDISDAVDCDLVQPLQKSKEVKDIYSRIDSLNHLQDISGKVALAGIFLFGIGVLTGYLHGGKNENK